MKILFINLQRTGDIFQSLHIIFAIKKKFPESKIYYLTNNIHLPALSIAANYIEKIFPIDYLTIFTNIKNGNFSKSINYFKNFLTELNYINFDLVYNLTFSKLSAILMNLIQGKRKEGAFLVNKDFIEIKNRFLKSLFVNIENKNFKENIVETYLKALNLHYAKPFFFKPDNKKIHNNVIFHPCASSSEKEWGITNYLNLAKIIKKNIIITGGKGDIEKNKKLEELLKQDNISVKNLTGKTDFIELLELFKETDFLVSGDTSIVHIAAFTPVKTITIFLGNAYHYHTYPYCPEKIVVYPEIKCYPCSATFNCANQLCKNYITPELVASIILNNYRNKNILETKLDKNGYIKLI